MIVIFIARIVLIILEQRENLNLIKMYVKLRFLWNGNAVSKGNIMQFNQYIKSNKMPYIIYADVKYLTKK